MQLSEIHETGSVSTSLRTKDAITNSLVDKCQNVVQRILDLKVHLISP